MRISKSDHAMIVPFLGYSYPSFRLRSDRSFTILGIIDAQQFIVEGAFTGPIPTAGLYGAEAAKEAWFEPSTSTPAPPDSHASHTARQVPDVSVLHFREDVDANLSWGELKALFNLSRGAEILFTPYVQHAKSHADENCIDVHIAYDNLELSLPAEGASGETYVLRKRIISALPNQNFECSITEEDVMILESQEREFYFLTSLEKVDLSDEGVIAKAAAIEGLAKGIIEV